jgi:CHAD domain-containing protein
MTKNALDPKTQLKRIIKHLKKIEFYFRKSISQPDNIENLHKLRVNIRNLYVNLNFLNIYYPKYKRKIILSGMKILKDCTNHIRDIDVFIDYFEKIFEINKTNISKNGIDGLYQELVEKRKNNFAELHQIFYDFISYDFFKYWRSILKNHHKFSPKYKEKYQIYLINRLKETWYRFEEKLQTDIDDEEELHQLRIAGKKFRYSFETVKELYPDETRKDINNIMVDIQDSLGTINDCKMILQLLDNKVTKFQDNNPMKSTTISHRYFFRLIQEKKKFFESQRENWFENRVLIRFLV